LTSNTEFPFNVKQSDPKGCIPTNISATLHALGLSGVTEGHLSQAYFSTICFANIVKLEVLSKLIYDGHLLSDFLNLEFYDAPQFENWWAHVTDWLQNHRFVLFAFKINSDSHIRTVVHFIRSSDTLETYDPDPQQPARGIPITKPELAAWWSEGKLNHDLLSISRR
jgi:hypothetical protein